MKAKLDIKTVHILINSLTTGKFRRVMENGRSHIVTDMIPIVGDTVMNRIFYPDAVVTAAMEQLDMLPVPANHPRVNGVKASIQHPLALNNHHIGGFTRNPKKVGKQVQCEFWLDEVVAAQSEKGKLVIQHIENGTRIPVSTAGGGGLHVAVGTGPDDGELYNTVVDSIVFDHTALCLDDKAAGTHVGTELLNEDASVDENGIETVLGNVIIPNSYNDMFDMFRKAVKDKFGNITRRVWLMDILLKENAVIVEVSAHDSTTETLIKVPYSIGADNEISFGDDIKEIVRKELFVEVENQQGDDEMEITTEIATKFLKDAGLSVVTDAELTAWENQKNKQTEADSVAFANFQSNKAEFDAWQATQKTELAAKHKLILENSELTQTAVEAMDSATADSMIKLIETKTGTQFENRLRTGGGNGAGNQSTNETVTESDLDDIMNKTDATGGK